MLTISKKYSKLQQYGKDHTYLWEAGWLNIILDSFPTHTMSLSPMPAKVENRQDTLRSEFLWRRKRISPI